MNPTPDDLDARLRTAHRRFDVGEDAAGRARLLAALPAIQPSRTGGRLMRWTMTAALAAGVAAAAVFLRPFGGTALALDDVAERVRAAKTVQFTARDTSMRRDERTVVRWAAPGHVRTDDYRGDTLTESRIHRADGAALILDYVKKTYRKEVTQADDTTKGLAGRFARAFADVPRDTARSIPAKEVAGVKAPGFEMPFRAVDADQADVPDRLLRVWVDPGTKLPVVFELVIGGDGRETGADIVWDAPMDAKLFDAAPPAGFTELTPYTIDTEKETDIAFAFRTYADLFGSYPKVDVPYPDVLGQAMTAKLNVGATVPRDAAAAKAYWERYEKAQRAGRGFTWLWGARQTFAEFRYHGKPVTPADKDKVLVRWKQPDGRYRVIYGDLRFATVEK